MACPANLGFPFPYTSTRELGGGDSFIEASFQFLDAFRKKKKIAKRDKQPDRISSVSQYETTHYHWPDSQEIWYLSIFRKYVERIQASFKSDTHTCYFTRRTMCIYDLSRLIPFRMRNVSARSCRENQNTHLLSNNISVTFVPFTEVMCKKYGMTGQATDGNTTHAHCVPNN